MKSTPEPELMGTQVQAEAHTAHHLPFAAADLDRQPELASRARLLCDKLPLLRLEILAYDLLRPASRATASAAAVVERYTCGAAPVLRQDCHHALFAAIEPRAAEGPLRETGLQQSLSIQVVSDRHLAVADRLL